MPPTYRSARRANRPKQRDGGRHHGAQRARRLAALVGVSIEILVAVGEVLVLAQSRADWSRVVASPA